MCINDVNMYTHVLHTTHLSFSSYQACHSHPQCHSHVIRMYYSQLHLECHLISISNLNLLGLFSMQRGKRDLENQIIIEIENEELTLQMQ